MPDFFETRVTGKLADVQSALEGRLKARKFGTLHVHDVRATLEAKGVPFATPLVIMDICNPVYAKQALEATGNRIAPAAAVQQRALAGRRRSRGPARAAGNPCPILSRLG